MIKADRAQILLSHNYRAQIFLRIASSSYFLFVNKIIRASYAFLPVTLNPEMPTRAAVAYA